MADSFWHKIGDLAEAVWNPIKPNESARRLPVAVFNSAQSAFGGEGDQSNNDFKVIGDFFNKHIAKPVINSSPVQTAIKPIIWSMDNASHGIATAWSSGDVAEAHGKSEWTPFYSPQAWKDAWNETKGISAGEAVLGGSVAAFKRGGLFGDPQNPHGGMFGNTPENQAERKAFEDWRRTTSGRVGSGALDILFTWYADPTIIGGKAVKAARAANKIEDAAKAEQVSTAFTGRGLAAAPEKQTVGGLFSNTVDESATRLARTVAKTDHMDTAATAAFMKPILDRSANASSIVALFGQAGRIGDVAVQRQVKADILLAAAGSKASQKRLIENSPAIARAMQRVSEAPAEFKVLDALSASGRDDQLFRRGDALTDAARAMSTPENAAELEAYGLALDRVHEHLNGVFREAEDFGGLERVGTTALDRAKAAARGRTAQQFYYQDGVSGRTVRVLHWAANQRSRGVVATNDAFRGHEELMDHLTRSKLFTGAERRAISQEWWQAPRQDMRNKVVDDLWDAMIAKAAARHGLSAAQAKRLVGQVGAARSAGRAYTAKEMEAARVAGKSRVVLNDPVTGTATSIDRALFETHLRNTVALPDTELIERSIREVKGTGTAADRVKSGEAAVLSATESLNDWWRLAVLARPGLFVRTQLDTQARVVAMIGATTAMHQAITGMGHKVGARLGRPEIVEASARAEDVLRQRQWLDDAEELRRQAEFVSGPDGQRLLDRAAQLEKQAAEPVTHRAPKRLGATDKTVKLPGGVQATTRAYESAEDMAALAPVLRTGGDVSIGDALLNITDKVKSKLVEDSGDWVSHAVDDLTWSQGYIRHVDAIRRSHTGRRVLTEGDSPTVDLVASLRKDDRVRQEWLNVKFDNESFDDWLDRVISESAYIAPTPKIRQAIVSGERLTEKDVDRMFAREGEQVADGYAARMPITGPNYAAYAGKTANPVKRVMENAVKVFSDVPDTVLGRHPLYVARYYQHFKELAAREVDRTGELSTQAQAHIEKAARHRAIQDVRQTLYDTARHTGAHAGLMRVVSPFLGAWEDAMMSWSRLMYDDPSRLGALVKTWTSPERAGLVVDEDGNRVHPGDEARTKYIAVPLGPLAGWAGVKSFKVNKNSFNSVFQGEVPWLPGVGPMVQVPAGEVATRAFPEIADPDGPVPGLLRPFVRSVLNGDAPKVRPGVGGAAADFAQQFTPAWLRSFADAFNPKSTSFTNVFADSINSQIIAARDAGKPVPSRDALLGKALSAARNTTIVKAVALGVLGVSGQGAGTAEFYSNQYNLLREQEAKLKSQGKTVEQEFNRLFPEAAGLNWSVSFNETGVNATVKTEDRARKFRKEIEGNPEYGWFYVGADNIGGEFSASVYNAQSSRGLTPGSSKTQRHRVDPVEQLDRTLSSQGWDQYNQIMTRINLMLEDRGLHSLSQNGAEDLRQIQKVFVEQLKQQNPSWSKDFDNFDTGKRDRFIREVAVPATKDPKLRNRPDIVRMRQYLELRQKAMSIAAANGYTLGSQKAAPLLGVLAQAGQALAAEDIGFEQVWNRVLAREVEVGDDAAAAN